MFHPLPVFVGLRYVRTRRQGFFVSFISWVSMLGVCLGVAALITIISVMNGFEGELRNRLVALTAHATGQGPPELMRDWQSWRRARARCAACSRRGAVRRRAGDDRAWRPCSSRCCCTGSIPRASPSVSTIEQHLLQGTLADLAAGQRAA